MSLIIFHGVKFTLIIPSSSVFVFVVIPELENEFFSFAVLFYLSGRTSVTMVFIKSSILQEVWYVHVVARQGPSSMCCFWKSNSLIEATATSSSNGFSYLSFYTFARKQKINVHMSAIFFWKSIILVWCQAVTFYTVLEMKITHWSLCG